MRVAEVNKLNLNRFIGNNKLDIREFLDENDLHI